MAKYFLYCAMMLLFFTWIPSARADSIVDVEATDVQLYPYTVDISMQLDLTTLTVIDAAATAAGSGVQFTFEPLTCPSAPSGSPGPECSLFTSSTYALFNFSAADGSYIQFGDDDYSEAFYDANGGYLVFPAVGTYESFLVQGQLGGIGPNGPFLGPFEFGQGGSVTATEAPEPATVELMGIGFVFLGMLYRMGRASRQAIPPEPRSDS